jgi:hypothetical protein
MCRQKNPNVMFELGLRLAFDRATIIIKDDNTTYNFDTSPIEHLTYPRDLRYSLINTFKEKLLSKIRATYQKSLESGYSTFLKSFIRYKPKLEVKAIPGEQYIIKTLQILSQQVAELKSRHDIAELPIPRPVPSVDAQEQILDLFRDYRNVNPILTRDLDNPEFLKGFMRFVEKKNRFLTPRDVINAMGPLKTAYKVCA